MYCPKCGVQNPDNGKFCRSCGTDLAGVSGVLSSKPEPQQLINHKGKPVHWEGAMSKLFTGVAFLVIAIILAVTGMAGGRVWWFWLLIPAFTMIGVSVAQMMQLKRREQGSAGFVSPAAHAELGETRNTALPPPQAEWAPVPENRYKTGDLVPPSVTDATTRHLKMESEGETKTLPKK